MAELNRRQALKQLGVVGTGAVLGGVISGCTPSMAAKQNIDADVLNFALNLGTSSTSRLLSTSLR